MIPADSEDIRKEFTVLENELSTYNPELASKQKILAITKCDMLDQDLMQEMQKELPNQIQTIFISSVSGFGIPELKDLIWEELNKEIHNLTEVVHRPMD